MTIKLNISIRVLLFVVCFYCCSAFDSRAGGLFNYNTTDQDLNSQQQHYANAWTESQYTGAYTFVTVNVNEFTKTSFELTLPDKTTLTVTQREVIPRDGKRFSWKGLFNPNGNADFVINGDMVTARIANNTFVYSLYPLTGGLHILFRVNTILFPDDESPQGYRDMIEQGMHANDLDRRQQATDPEGGPQGPESLLAGNCKVRILCAFTDDVQTALADPLGLVISAIDATNTSYSNSSVNFSVELGRAIETSYAESGNSTTDKTRFRNTADGFMDEIHDARAFYDCDLCILIVNSLSNACGEAYTVAVSPYADAFCCVDRGCAVGNLSFPHELGHLYGCRHDRYVDATNTPYAYGHGWTSTPAANFRTVMAYVDSCTDNGFSCTRVSQWSNPALSYNGATTGLAGSRDNESALEASRSAIGALESTTTNKAFAAETVTIDESGDVIALTSVQNTSGAAYVLNSGSFMTWRAGTYHVLNPGFWAKSGSFFQTSYDDCTALAAPLPDPNRTTSQLHSAFPQPGEAVVWPNPFSNKFELTFNNTAEGQIHVFVTNAMGKEVHELFQGHTATIGLQAFEFDLTFLSPGVYFCTLIEPSGNIITKQLVKVH